MLAILGRQPKISQAELISLYGSVKMINPQVAAIDHSPIDINKLGGTVKLAEVITTLTSLNWPELTKSLLRDPELKQRIAAKPGKVVIGLSAYGFKLSQGDLFKFGLQLKRILRQDRLSIRIVTPSGTDTNAAVVRHNNLIEKGLDLLFIRGQNHTLVGATVQVQDINSYSARDYSRPARSAKIGMLPPKLAQIMINLANPTRGGTILDPFCGTGVVLQEALLLSFKVIGSDLNPDMVMASKQNLTWIKQLYDITSSDQVIQADATAHRWQDPLDAIITEGDLGPNLTTPPSMDQLKALQGSAAKLILGFLANLHPQIKTQTPVCLALPAWKHASGFKRLEIIDQISALGYTIKQFLPVTTEEMLYRREDQMVARELVVLIKN